MKPTLSSAVRAVTANSTTTLTNKSISGSTNTLSSLPADGIVGVIPVSNLASGVSTGAKFIRDDGTLSRIPVGSAIAVDIEDAMTAANWSLVGTLHGNISNPADDPVVGPVLDINVTDVGTQATYMRDLSINANEFAAGLSFFVKRDANLATLDVYLYYTNHAQTVYSRLTKSASSFDSGRWVQFTAPPSNRESAIMNTSDADNITGVAFAATATGGVTTTLQIAGLTGREVRAGTVTFLFDNARLDTYTTAFPTMASYGFIGALAPEYSRLGTTPSYSLMTQANVDEMYAAGWEVVAHHYSNMTALTEAQQVVIYRAQKDWMRTNGFTRGAHIWVWPGGSRNSASETYARRYYKTMRRVGAQSAVGIPGVFDSTHPEHLYVTIGHTAANLLYYVDAVKNYGGSLVLVFHSLVSSKVAAEDFLISDFETVCAGIDSRGMSVVPLSNVWTEY